MSKDIKYVVFNETTAIILPDHVPHVDIRLGNQTPTSAGFIQIHDAYKSGEIPVSVYGESIGLKLKSRPLDANLVCKTLGKSWDSCRTQQFIPKG